MGKYEPLKDFLQGRHGSEIPMTFRELEQLLGVRLPASKRYPAWWSNNPSNNVMTKVWLDAGYRTEQVDIAGERLVFRKADQSPARPTEGASILAAVRAAMKGTVTIPEGVDLTEPSGEVWDAEAE